MSAGAAGGPPARLGLAALAELPDVRAGDDIGGLVAGVLPSDAGDGDIVVVAHKVVSKAEGRTRRLAGVEPGERARAIAASHGRDPRLVQVVLDEAAEVLRAERGVLVCVTRHGLVCANGGVDRSNVPGDEALLLPVDPDRSARALRERIEELRGIRPGVVIADSFGRAWRLGQVDVAIGAAGIVPLDDWRGRPDAHGRELSATLPAVADAVAAAADLTRTKDSRQPTVLVRGLDRVVTREHGPGAAALKRPRDEDLFR